MIDLAKIREARTRTDAIVSVCKDCVNRNCARCTVGSVRPVAHLLGTCGLDVPHEIKDVIHVLRRDPRYCGLPARRKQLAYGFVQRRLDISTDTIEQAFERWMEAMP